MPKKKKNLRKQVTELQARRDGVVAEFETITRGAVDGDNEPRSFTETEAETRGRLTAQRDQLDAEIRSAEDAVRKQKKASRQARMDDKITQVRRDLGLGDVPAGSVGGSIGSVTNVNESGVYERDNGVSYLKDTSMVAFPAGAIGAEWFRAMERLQAHGRENHFKALEVEGKSNRDERDAYFLSQMFEARNDRSLGQGPAKDRGVSYRALSAASTAGGEFVPPQYLTDDWIKFLRAGRVVADNCNHQPLPDGTMSINIPRVTSGTAVGTQGAQNTNVPNTDLQTSFVTFPVVTKAGEQIVSLQLLERSPIAFDAVVTADLALAYAQQVDQAIIFGAGGGDVTGILNTAGITTIAWTQSTPTIGGMYGRIGVAKRAVAQGLYLPATHAFMTPDNWEWIGQSFDGQGRPLVVPSYAGPYNPVQVGPDAAQAEGAIGRRLSGLNAFEDANIPVIGGNDEMIVSRMEMNNLYESPVVNRALPQTYGAQLSVLLQLYGYIAFTAARYPQANAVITGTGMANPRVYQS
jgi:HK97 family phage major capsid protein